MISLYVHELSYMFMHVHLFYYFPWSPTCPEYPHIPNMSQTSPHGVQGPAWWYINSFQYAEHVILVIFLENFWAK